MTGRMVFMTAEQAAELDRYIELLMRANKNKRAAAMMNLALAYKFADEPEPERPSNVIQFDAHSRKVPCT